MFNNQNLLQKTTITYDTSGNSIEYNWESPDTCDKLGDIDIFDNSFGNVFIGNGDEVSYEPPIWFFFSSLIGVCEDLLNELDNELALRPSNLPSIPLKFKFSESASWLQKIKFETTSEEIKKHCSLSKGDEKEINILSDCLKEHSPAEKSSKLKIKKTYVDTIIQDVRKYQDKLSDENCKRIIAVKVKYNLKKRAADLAAKQEFTGSKLDGIGSEIWQELWTSAQKYSTEIAYKNQEFPVLEDGSVCVLCQQSLSEDAKQRFISFDAYIKDETQKEVDKAYAEYKNLIDSLDEIPTLESLNTKIDAAEINENELKSNLIELFTTFGVRKNDLLELEVDSDSSTLKDFPSLFSFTENSFPEQEIQAKEISQKLESIGINKLHELSKNYDEQSQQYNQDALKDNRDELQKKLDNLLMKQWLSENIGAIQNEIDRLKILNSIQEAKKRINLQSLSKKKGELAESLITKAFVDRFNKELHRLGASRIKVNLIKLKTSKGRVLHKLQLENAINAPLPEILSDGEKRIVSIAAFLADVTGRVYPSPFIFDDPISSLDQDFEEAVVRRLCELSIDRQVIIFTHRLSLLGLIHDYARKLELEPNISCIRRESWGAGEQGDTPLFAKRPDKALSLLINERLPKARKKLNENGIEEYRPDAELLCKDFRILLERMIECELIADVIQRYRRAINTIGKIDKLAKITEEDCSLFDSLMTKYSRYEHSQPDEAPVSLPNPDELLCDFKMLQEWQNEFKSRLAN